MTPVGAVATETARVPLERLASVTVTVAAPPATPVVLQVSTIGFGDGVKVNTLACTTNGQMASPSDATNIPLRGILKIEKLI